jgi:hypothetical protein
MADSIFISHYSESEVERDLDRHLTEPEYEFWHDRLPPGEVMIRDGLAQVYGSVIAIAICYAGLGYDAARGGEYKTISWAGARVSKQAILRAYAQAAQGRPVILTSRREINEALNVMRLLIPGTIDKEPTNVVAWSLREAATGG